MGNDANRAKEPSKDVIALAKKKKKMLKNINAKDLYSKDARLFLATIK